MKDANHLKKILWSGAAAGFIILLSYFILWNKVMQADQEFVDLVVATKEIPSQTVVDASFFKIAKFPKNFKPKNILVSLEGLTGKILNNSMVENQVLIKDNLIANQTGVPLSSRIPRDQAAFILPANWLAAPMPKIKRGDHISIVLPGFMEGGQFSPKVFPELQSLKVEDLVLGDDGLPKSIWIYFPHELGYGSGTKVANGPILLLRLRILGLPLVVAVNN